MCRIFLNADNTVASTGYQFDTDASCSGKQIKSCYSFFKIDIVIEYIKQIFFGEICRRACFKCSRHVKSSSFVNTANYSHVNKACMSILVAGFMMNTCRINFFNSLIKTSFSGSIPVRCNSSRS